MNAFQKVMSICVSIVFSTSLNAMFFTARARQIPSTVIVHKRTWFGGTEDPRWQKQQAIAYRSKQRALYGEQFMRYNELRKEAKTDEGRRYWDEKITRVMRDIDYIDELER